MDLFQWPFGPASNELPGQPSYAKDACDLLQAIRVATPPIQQAILDEWDRHGVSGYSIDPIINWIQFDHCSLCATRGLMACTGHSYVSEDDQL